MAEQSQIAALFASLGVIVFSFDQYYFKFSMIYKLHLLSGCRIRCMYRLVMCSSYRRHQDTTSGQQLNFIFENAKNAFDKVSGDAKTGARNYKALGIGGTISIIAKEEGISAFYKGVKAAAMREMSYTSLRLGLYGYY